MDKAIQCIVPSWQVHWSRLPSEYQADPVHLLLQRGYDGPRVKF